MAKASDAEQEQRKADAAVQAEEHGGVRLRAAARAQRVDNGTREARPDRPERSVTTDEEPGQPGARTVRRQLDDDWQNGAYEGGLCTQVIELVSE